MAKRCGTNCRIAERWQALSPILYTAILCFLDALAGSGNERFLILKLKLLLVSNSLILFQDLWSFNRLLVVILRLLVI